MPLFERLMGVVGEGIGPKIPVHAFQAVVSEWAKGQITGAQAQTAITHVSGAPLTSQEISEVQSLVATVPGGTTTANKADRALRLQEIDQLLLLADTATPPYDTPAALRARLGIT